MVIKGYIDKYLKGKKDCIWNRFTKAEMRRTTYVNSYFLLKKWRKFDHFLNPTVNFVLNNIIQDNQSSFVIRKLDKLLKQLLIIKSKADIKSVTRRSFNLAIKWEDGRYDFFNNFSICVQEGGRWYGQIENVEIYLFSKKCMNRTLNYMVCHN